jgi:hypothetical protein
LKNGQPSTGASQTAIHTTNRAERAAAGVVSPYGMQGSRPGSALPCRPADRSLVAEDRSAAGVRDQTGPDPSVRTGSVAHRDHRGTSGHQRSPTAKRTRSLMRFQLRQLVRRQPADQIVAPKVVGPIVLPLPLWLAAEESGLYLSNGERRSSTLTILGAWPLSIA